MSSSLDISLEPEGWQHHVNDNPGDYPSGFVNRTAREAHKAGFIWALKCIWQYISPQHLPDFTDVFRPIEFLIEGEWVDVSIDASWSDEGVTLTEFEDGNRFYPWKCVEDVRLQRELPNPSDLFPSVKKQ